MQKSYFGRLQQWIHAGYPMPAQKIIVRPENHWKSVTSLTLIRSKSIITRSRASTNWNDASTASGPFWVTRLLNVIMSSRIGVYALAFVLQRTFWAHTVIKMMWCDTCDFFWETITASHAIVSCQSVNHSNIHLIIALTAQSWHFNFPKVAQAHTLGEVGNLGTVLLRVYSETVLPIFIEIGLYLTDKEQNICWHSFFETRCSISILLLAALEYVKASQKS